METIVSEEIVSISATVLTLLIVVHDWAEEGQVEKDDEIVDNGEVDNGNVDEVSTNDENNEVETIEGETNEDESTEDESNEDESNEDESNEDESNEDESNEDESNEDESNEEDDNEGEEETNEVPDCVLDESEAHLGIISFNTTENDEDCKIDASEMNFIDLHMDKDIQVDITAGDNKPSLKNQQSAGFLYVHGKWEYADTFIGGGETEYFGPVNFALVSYKSADSYVAFHE